MDKARLIERIVERLSHDLELFTTAAKTAHQAATHEENQPDNKYDTLALEASYVAQGQANRAQEIRHAIGVYRQLSTAATRTVALASLVTIEGDDGSRKTVFIGPLEGGLRIVLNEGEVMVITPSSPLGQELLGKGLGDTAELSAGGKKIEYEIVELS
jgi:transcription elongation GreA/GreB family factor